MEAIRIDGWEVDGPHFKDAQHYLSSDRTNPEAPWPGYGWPLGTECWYFRMRGHGYRLFATGSTIQKAADRVFAIAAADNPGRFSGVIR